MSRWTETAAVLTGVVLLGAAGGCRERGRPGDEGARTKAAFEKFIDFGMSNESYDFGKKETKAPPAKVRRRAVNNTMSPRMRLELEVELPFDLAGKALEAAMLANARAALANTEYQAVRVRAWPGTLQRFGGTMGYAVVAVDGQGWDGERLGYREAKVMLTEGAPRPNALEYQILAALEQQAAALARQKKPPKEAALRRQAEANVAQGMGLQLAAIRTAVTKAEAYYMKE